MHHLEKDEMKCCLDEMKKTWMTRFFSRPVWMEMRQKKWRTVKNCVAENWVKSTNYERDLPQKSKWRRFRRLQQRTHLSVGTEVLLERLAPHTSLPWNHTSGSCRAVQKLTKHRLKDFFDKQKPYSSLGITVGKGSLRGRRWLLRLYWLWNTRHDCFGRHSRRLRDPPAGPFEQRQN